MISARPSCSWIVPLDFNLAAFELAKVAHLLKIGREHDHGEGTCLVFAEVEERDAFAAIFHVQHGSADALGRADMLARFGEGDAVARRSIARIARGANPTQPKNSSKKESQSKKTHNDRGTQKCTFSFILGVAERSYAEQDENFRGDFPKRELAVPGSPARPVLA
jgi:hypothetical protein